MAWENKKAISENSEQEIDSDNPNLKRTTFYARKIFLKDGDKFERYKKIIKSDDVRIKLPGGHWIESKRASTQFIVGKDSITNFALDISIEESGRKYSLLNESQVITEERAIVTEWDYSHDSKPVFKVILKDNDFFFRFTAPAAGAYRLFLKITPVMDGLISSQIFLNKKGQPYSSGWVLKSGETLGYNFSRMSNSVSAKDIALKDHALFLYSKNHEMKTAEEFLFG